MDRGFLAQRRKSPKTRPRLLVLGDSFVMSENEPYGNTFSAQLARLWEDQVEVLCAGVTGYGPDQSLLRLQQLLPTLSPDGVCLVLCSYNDFGDLVRNHLFDLDDQGKLVRRNATIHPTERAIFEARLAESKRPGLVRLWSDWRQWRGTSVPQANATWFADYLRAHREEHIAHVRGETVAFGLQKDIYDADVALYPEWDSSVYKRNLMGAVVGANGALVRPTRHSLCVHRGPGGAWI